MAVLLEKKVPKLPIPGRRNILITSALPYVNNVPRLGNIIGCVLSVDVFAHYYCLCGYNAIYVCGTDEYGTSTETKAMEEGCTPQDICDKYHAIHRDACDWFDISFDEFGRTSTPQQTKICQEIFNKLMERKWLLKESIDQFYCEKHERFLADRLVEGTCPRPTCNYDSEELVKYIDTTSVAGFWIQNNYKDKIFYVWFDAPIGYISITSFYTSDWEKWWKNPDNVELYQFIGKDNVTFHTIMFPSCLIGTGENWTKMKTVSVTEYLNYEAGKFSKSKGICVFGNDAEDTGIPSEVWRYYLLTIKHEVSDIEFTLTDLQAKLKSELPANLRNFINRVLSFIAKPSGIGYGSIVPDAPNTESHSLTKALAEKVGNYVEQYVEAVEKVKLKQGLKTAMSISSEGNCYLQASQFWKLYKENPASCAVVMRTSVALVYILASLLESFMPSISVEVVKHLILPSEFLPHSLSNEKGDTDRAGIPWEIVPSGHKIGTPKPLFKELKDEEVKFFMEKFAGSQSDKKYKADEKEVADHLKKMKLSDAKNKRHQNLQVKGNMVKTPSYRLDYRFYIFLLYNFVPTSLVYFSLLFYALLFFTVCAITQLIVF
ncbi:hypothetical protein MKX03_018257 [Papaver bracteatum]|nr:hypothetical protein MKX03_018257 [Papaver bracteatum]